MNSTATGSWLVTGWRVALRRSSERGASAVEFAIIAPLFFMITFGMITGAIAFNQKNQLTHASREGARYGATLPVDGPIAGCTGSTGPCWAQNVADVAIDRSFGDIDLSKAGHRVCVSLVEGDPATVVSGNGTYRYDNTGGSGPCFTDDGVDSAQRVQVLVERPGFINAVLFRFDVTLGSEALAKHEVQEGP